MKNISRRVFIKGMAVAAVATAASSVLAGCNFVPGTEETPVAGFSPITKTLTVDADEEQSAAITVKSVSNLYDDAVKLELSFTNKTDRKLYFVNNSSMIKTDGAQVNVVVSAYFDGQYMSKAPVAGVDTVVYNLTGAVADATSGFAFDTEAAGVTKTYVHEGNLYFQGTEDWKTMTLVLTFLDADQKTTKEVQYVINK